MKDSFDFLGYNFKLYPHAKKTHGYSFLVKPSRKSIKNIVMKLKEIFTTGHKYSVDFLIGQLNPVIRG